MTEALIMAGGRGERMRATHGPTPKPLVPVRGQPLLERNVSMLLREGFDALSVSVTAELPALGAWAHTRGAALASAGGARWRVLEETAPLGTIGVAARLRGASEVVVVNADNLITMDLRALVAHHRAVGADCTVATHLQPFKIPFGEVVVEDGRLLQYREKPEVPVRVSSGTYVLGARALEALESEVRCDLPTLVARLLSAGSVVGAYAHASPWIDVNDSAAVARAEALVGEHPERFERWDREPDVSVVGALLWEGDALLLERRDPASKSYPGQWDTPGGKIEPGESPRDALARELYEELGVLGLDLAPRAVFDDLDPASGKRFRHHVFEASVPSGGVRAREAQTLRRWRLPELANAQDVGVVVWRSLAWRKTMEHP